MLDKFLDSAARLFHSKGRKEFEAQFAQDVDKEKNYMLWKPGAVFTGQQVLNLMWHADRMQRLMVVMDLKETELPATSPDTELGPAEEK